VSSVFLLTNFFTAPPGGTLLFRPLFPMAEVSVLTFGTAPGYLGDQQVGVLYAKQNQEYVFCKAWGKEVSERKGIFNHWWLWTNLDQPAGKGWVSAYFLKNQGNDVAQDKFGKEIPTC
jgi:hypothetical protein